MAHIKKTFADDLLKYRKNPTAKQQKVMEEASQYRNEAVKNYRRRKGQSVHFGPMKNVHPETAKAIWGDR